MPKVEVQNLGFVSKSGMCEVISQEIDFIRATLSRVDFDSSNTGPSQAVKAALGALDSREGWEKKFLIARDAHSALSTANYSVNYLFVQNQCTCKKKHKVFFHVCFDNRQAIGTNLLRMKIGLDSARSDQDDYYSVALVMDVRSKKRFGWDNAAGTFQEYAHALEIQYSNIFELPITFLIYRAS